MELSLPTFNSSSTNPKEAWNDFSRCFNSYVTLKDFRDYPSPTGENGTYKPEEQQIISRKKEKEVAALTIALDAEGRKILEYVLALTDSEKKDPTVILQKFKDHFAGQKHDLFARDKCWSAHQEQTETIAQWEARVKVLINDCNYKNDIMEHSRDRFVIGIQNKSIKQRLFMKGDNLTFTDAVTIAKSYEATEAKLKSEEVNVLSQKYIRQGPKSAVARPKRGQKQNPACPWCGDGPHKKRDCPAQGHQCKKCQKLNHYEKVCMSTMNNRKHRANAAPQVMISMLQTALQTMSQVVLTSTPSSQLENVTMCTSSCLLMHTARQSLQNVL